MSPREVLRRYGDLLLAGVLAITMTVEILTWTDHDRPVSVLCGLLATLPAAVRRTNPLVSFVLMLSGIELIGWRQPGFDNDSSTFVVAFFLTLYSVGRHAEGTDRWLSAPGLLIAMFLFAEGEGGMTTTDPGDIAFLVAFVGAPWATGLTIQLRREREAVLNAANEQLRSEQEELARRAVAEERARIARELHDVVSHAISVTVLQARGARRTVGHDEEQVRRALDAIEHTNTAALSDMRRLLAVLRDTEPDGLAAPDDRAPQPSLAHLGTLVGHVRSSGLPVELATSGTPGEVPPGVDLSAYRIVQEALTNVLKHAGPATVCVSLDYRPDELRVTVRDTGSGGDINGSGHGLIGIRERVSVVGGEVSAGPVPDGGFEVVARLPYAMELS